LSPPEESTMTVWDIVKGRLGLPLAFYKQYRISIASQDPDQPEFDLKFQGLEGPEKGKEIPQHFEGRNFSFKLPSGRYRIFKSDQCDGKELFDLDIPGAPGCDLKLNFPLDCGVPPCNA